MTSVRPKLSADSAVHLTAWDTSTGRVIYWTGSDWSELIDRAAILQGEAASKALSAAQADEARATDPYLMEAAPGGGATGRETLRETIRASGPTTHPQFQRA